MSANEPVAVSFRTPGLIDPRAFTTFGLNSKPNSDNPIGYFGTGLKYAIAVLLRIKLPVVIWIGKTRYEFLTDEQDFRGKEFTFIRMRKSYGLLKSFTQHDMPFTTELGKNWELWQAFRELEANTRDEKGWSNLMYLKSDVFELDVNDQTVIYVGGREIVDIFRRKDDIFLNKEDVPLLFTDEHAGIEVYGKPSKHIYYRGLRVHDLPKDQTSKYTYNFIREMALTEDRTLRDASIAVYWIADVVIQSNHYDYINNVVISDKDSFEATIPIDYTQASPSDAFKRVMKEKDTEGKALPRARTYYSSYVARTAPPPKPKDNLRAAIEQWRSKFAKDPDDADVKSDLCLQADKLFRRVLENEDLDMEVASSDSDPDEPMPAGLQNDSALDEAEDTPKSKPEPYLEVVLTRKDKRNDINDEVPF